MKKLETVVAQTELLLAKQKELMVFYKNEFRSLYNFLQKEEEKGDKGDSDAFQNVYYMLGIYERDALGYIDEEVEFLEEQLKMFAAITGIEDKEQREMVAETVMQEFEDVQEMDKFTADVEAEITAMKSAYKDRVADLKEVFVEDGIKELEVLFDGYIVHRQKEQEAEEEEMERMMDEEDLDDELCCGGAELDCSGCSSKCDGVNIFQGLEDEIAQEDEV